MRTHECGQAPTHVALPSGHVHALRRDRQLAVPPRKVFWFCACTQENQKSLCVGGTAVGGSTAFRRQLYSENHRHLKDFHALFVDQTCGQSLFKSKFSSIRGGFSQNLPSLLEIYGNQANLKMTRFDEFDEFSTQLKISPFQDISFTVRLFSENPIIFG